MKFKNFIFMADDMSRQDLFPVSNNFLLPKEDKV